MTRFEKDVIEIEEGNERIRKSPFFVGVTM